MLIKAVVQAIPAFVIRRFWWGASEGKRGICWKAWDHLCHSKVDRRLGFRDFENFNHAMLVKKLRRLHLYSDSLLARTLKARYFPNSDIWNTGLGYSPSFGWRSMWSARSLLKLGARWKIEDGRRTRVWVDAWLPGPGSGKGISPNLSFDRELTVDYFIDSATHEWREDLV